MLSLNYMEFLELNKPLGIEIKSVNASFDRIWSLLPQLNKILCSICFRIEILVLDDKANDKEEGKKAGFFLLQTGRPAIAPRSSGHKMTKSQSQCPVCPHVLVALCH